MPEQSQDPTASRIDNATQLVQDFELDKDANFFSDPENRIAFLQSLEFEDFFSIVQHANARMRSFEPRDRINARDKGSYLPMLKTPDADDKRKTFQKGFEVIQDYLHTTDDSAEDKARGVGMAVEALIIWVHPFDDANGRTSRFMGKFIEDGTEDVDGLVSETADKNERLRMYKENLRVDKHNTVDWRDEELLLDDDEREEIRVAQEAFPITDGIPASIGHLLHDKGLQEGVLQKEAAWRAAKPDMSAET